MSIAVMFLATAIIFVASTPVARSAFAQTIGEEEEVNQVSNTGSQNYENFLTCLSDAGGQHSYPAGNQIVNCLVESGYVQGSSSSSNSADSEDQSKHAQTSSVDDQSNSDDDQSDHQSNSDDDQSNSGDDQSNSDDDQSNSGDDQSDHQSNSDDDQSDDGE
jgi:hypothetical protein